MVCVMLKLRLIVLRYKLYVAQWGVPKNIEKLAEKAPLKREEGIAS